MIFKMIENIKVCFITSVTDLSIGSYRIWINDLSKYLVDRNISVSINKIDAEADSNVVIILGKSDTKKAKFYKSRYPNNLVGIINPMGNTKYDVDFIIVGSLEEKDSLSQNKNVFIFPLIESSYQGITKKTHTKKDNIVIGMHGNYSHLSKLRPHLKGAIEDLNKEIDVHLKVLTNANAPRWIYGRPEIQNIEIIDWKFDTFSQSLLTCDVGIVPNITDYTPRIKRTSKRLGLYSTDHYFRLKNKSNSGRMFVFIQHGIPVVADLTPSNMHILGNPDNGYAVFSRDGWLNAFHELLDHNKRNKISNNAIKEFNRLYNPIDWANKLISNIEGLKNGK